MGWCTTDPADAARALGLGHTQGEEVRRNAGLRTAPAARADRVYTGVLYEALDLPGLPAPARQRAARRLCVVSALFGLLRPTDAIPAYRLSGGTALPRIGPVARHWAGQLGDVVSASAGDGLVLDLRSSAYAGFWRPGRDLADRVVALRVLQAQGGRRTVVSHHNKATKGRLVRDLLRDGSSPRRPAGLADLLGDLGWRVEPGARAGQLDVVVAAV